MKKIFYEHEGSTFSVEFNYGSPLRWSHKGKHWPHTTQCVIKLNDLIIGIGDVIKHEKDKNNPKYARMYAAKKAFKNSEAHIWLEVREALWKQILTD